MEELSRFCLGVVQNGSNDFVNSLITIAIFLVALGSVGFLIVQFCKRGNIVRFAQKIPLMDADKISILDAKFLYGRRCLYLVKCSNRKILFLLDREHSCKLGEWREDRSEKDDR